MGRWLRQATVAGAIFVGGALAACSSDGDVLGDDPIVEEGAFDASVAASLDASKGETDAAKSDAAKAAPDAATPRIDTGAPDAHITDAAVHADGKAPVPRDITFYVVADTHADPVESYDLRATARAINAVSRGGTWPARIGGVATDFAGGPIAAPRGVVFVGDLTGWGVAATELPTFRRYFQKGTTAESILSTGYVGLGNHDVDDADRDPASASANRAAYWSFVDARHRGPNAPVPVDRFDDATHAYSWNWGDVHFVQTHRFPGDTQYGLPSSRAFLANDLATVAGDGRPVFLFHHYGMDPFGTQDRWWTAVDRSAYRAILKGYGVSAIFVGHSHAATQYSWEGLRVFHVNNAKAENSTGNNDGNGSFAIVRITDRKLDVVTCRWLDDQGHYELIGPYFSGPANPGRAP